MALPITPAIGSVTNVKTSVISSEHVPFHIISDNTGNVLAVATEPTLQNVVIGLSTLNNTFTSGIIATGPAGNPGSELITVQGAPGMTPFKSSGYTFAVSNTFTRPSDTTQYSIGDLVASNTINTSVVFPRFNVARTEGESGVITKVRLFKNDNDLVNASFRIHFYTTAPTPNRGDNLGWQTNWANAYLDSVDITFDKSFLDGTTASKTTEIPFQLTSNAIWAAVEARGAYTPTSSGTFTITLYGYQD